MQGCFGSAFFGNLRYFPAVPRYVSLLLIWLVLAGWPTVGVAQLATMRLAKAGARVVRVPLKVRRNLLLVPVTVNGQGPYQFVLDTGVNLLLLTDAGVRDSLRLPAGEALLVEGAGEESALRAELVAGVRVALPGVAEAPLTVAVLSGDALELSRYVGEPVAGLIGADVFRSFVVEVRSEEGVLRLHDPAQFVAPRRAARVALAVRAGKPYVRAHVRQESAGGKAGAARDGGEGMAGDTLTATFLVDTGAGHALSLETGSHPALRLPEQRLRAQVGRGLSGPINGWLGRVAVFRLGPFELRRLLASFPDSAAVRAKVQVPRQGNVGYELLKRFRVWFDYPGRTLWLQPGSRFREPFEHDMSGLEIVARGPSYSRYVVDYVQPEAPGEEAGLQEGDELLLIDGKKAGEFTLTTLSQLLHSRHGRRIPLLVRRGAGDFFYTTLTLRRAI